MWYPGTETKGTLFPVLEIVLGCGGLETWVPFLVLPCLGGPGHAASVSPPAPHDLLGSGQCYYYET